MRVLTVVLGAALAAAPFAFWAAAAPQAQTKKSAAAPKKKSSAKKKTARSGPPKQMQPTADRYREIQQALIERGYLTGEPTGVWDERSVNAWKKLEEAEDLPVDGKLDSKGLMAIGLAPDRQAAAAKSED